MLRRLLLVTAGAILALGVLAPAVLAGEDKVALCHKPGTPAEGTLLVAPAAVDAHLAHGDALHECGWIPVEDACTYLNAQAQDSVYAVHEPVTLDFVGDELISLHSGVVMPQASIDATDFLGTCLIGIGGARCFVNAAPSAAGPASVSWSTVSGATTTWTVWCGHG